MHETVPHTRARCNLITKEETYPRLQSPFSPGRVGLDLLMVCLGFACDLAVVPSAINQDCFESSQLAKCINTS